MDSTSQAGHSVHYTKPEIWHSYSPAEMFSLAEEFQQVYLDAVSTLASNGNGSPDDPTIFNMMMEDDRMQTITEVYHDYTTLNWPTRL